MFTSEKRKIWAPAKFLCACDDSYQPMLIKVKCHIVKMCGSVNAVLAYQ